MTSATTPRHDVVDLTLAEFGSRRVEWAGREMPVLAGIAKRMEVHKTAETIGVLIPQCRQLTTSHRVTDKQRRLDLQRVQNPEHVVREPLVVVTRRRLTRGTVASSRNAVDVAAVGQLRREVIEDVRAVARSGQQHDRPARSAPIEHLESNALLHDYEPDLVFRGVLPGDGVLTGPRLPTASGRDQADEQDRRYSSVSTLSHFEHLGYQNKPIVLIHYYKSSEA